MFAAKHPCFFFSKICTCTARHTDQRLTLRTNPPKPMPNGGPHGQA